MQLPTVIHPTIERMKFPFLLSICFLDSPIHFPYLRFDATRWRLSSCRPVTSIFYTIYFTPSKHPDPDTILPNLNPKKSAGSNSRAQIRKNKKNLPDYQKFRVYSLLLAFHWSLLLMVHSHCGGHLYPLPTTSRRILFLWPPLSCRLYRIRPKWAYFFSCLVLNLFQLNGVDWSR